MQNSIISNNQAEEGAGIYVGCSQIYVEGIGLIYDDNVRGIVENCKVFNNHAIGEYGEGKGGGIFNKGGIVENCKVFNNHAQEGGGIANGYSYERGGIVKNCIVTDNVSDFIGGGISNYGTVLNCVIINNSGGGGISIEGYDVLGGGIYNGGYAYEPYDVYVYNSTIVNNFPDNYSNYNIEFEGINPQTYDYNCIKTSYDLSPNFVNSTSFEGIAKTDVQKVELENADWSLKSTSPYINAGDASILPKEIALGTDIIGNPRISGGQIDLGAYEYIPGSSISDNVTMKSINYTIDNGMLKIWDIDVNYKVQVFDINGKIQSEINSTSNVSQIKLPQMGVYIINIQLDNQNLTQKIVW